MQSATFHKISNTGIKELDELITPLGKLIESIELLLGNDRIESAAIVAASVWERCVTIEYILTNPSDILPDYLKHAKINRMPWKVIQMVKGILRTEMPLHITPDKKDVDVFYKEYIILSAIKHGNPQHTADDIDLSEWVKTAIYNRIESLNKKIAGLSEEEIR